MLNKPELWFEMLNMKKLGNTTFYIALRIKLVFGVYAQS